MKEFFGGVAIVGFMVGTFVFSLFFGTPTIFYLHERYCCWLWPKGQVCQSHMNAQLYSDEK